MLGLQKKMTTEMGGVSTKNAEVLRHFCFITASYKRVNPAQKRDHHYHHSNLHFDLLYSKKHFNTHPEKAQEAVWLLCTLINLIDPFYQKTFVNNG